jgi:hypothetical protein
MSHEGLTGDVDSQTQCFHRANDLRENFKAPRSRVIEVHASSQNQQSELLPGMSSSNCLPPAEDENRERAKDAAACVVSIQVLRLGSADYRKRSTARKENQRSPLPPRWFRSGRECFGILQSNSSGTSEKKGGYRTLKEKAIASLKSNARVAAMAFKDNFGDFRKFSSLEENQKAWAYN